MSSTGLSGTGLSNRPTVLDPSASTDAWIVENLDCGVLTEVDRGRIFDGIQRCYRATDLPWHDHVVWVRSPQELASVVASSRKLIHRWHRQRVRRAGRVPRLLTLGRWAAWIGLRVLAVLAAVAVLVAISWFWFGSLTGPNHSPIGALAYLGFIASWSMVHVVGHVTLWAWRSTVDRVDAARNLKYRIIQPRFVQETRRLLMPAADPRRRPESDSGVDAEADSQADEALAALAPIWYTLWLAPVRSARPPAEVSVREAMACAIPARPMVGWIAYRSLTIVCEPPLELHTEQVAGAIRLHNAAGPAVVWADAAGSVDYYLHGVRVPEHLYREDVRVDDLHREQNSEVRRVVIERLGWPKYIEQAGLRLVASAVDPGNGERELKLYDLPKELRDTKRLLLMVNGSPDHSGRQRQYAELVPAGFDDPIAAVAWQYDCPVEVYRQLARRT